MADCGGHKDMIVMHAFSQGTCEICGQQIITGHIPCDKVCDHCSDTKGLCRVCGKPVKKKKK